MGFYTLHEKDICGGFVAEDLVYVKRGLSTQQADFRPRNFLLRPKPTTKGRREGCLLHLYYPCKGQNISMQTVLFARGTFLLDSVYFASYGILEIYFFYCITFDKKLIFRNDFLLESAMNVMELLLQLACRVFSSSSPSASNCKSEGQCFGQFCCYLDTNIIPRGQQATSFMFRSVKGTSIHRS